MTWAPVGAIKRPSEVPPAVDKLGSILQTVLIACFTLSISSPSLVTNGWPDNDQSSV